ncbi:transport protein particle (trapp) component, bet3 protein [Toxoplasma gondii TgCatPRC2]|uniref:Transport protein particle (Trapp) component, bet3 protein n=2 Tax=Toxoplasma gondii TaxID=5811 RepID=A0A151HGV5_TOXGO|nr:transport protein particle (trapp) component, bet3 protein [Toxoplasma gondii p89]KYK68550.1 transport protein particle (trapp) component, bet3 protein [Toxoplasma gondii TgCatPRC2]
MLSSGARPGFFMPSGSSVSAQASPAVLSPPVVEVAASGLQLLQQEVVSYAARRSRGDRAETVAVLEAAGFQIGVRLLERLSLRLSTRMWEQRECLKFVCKDLWQVLFQKQADRLQTNRRGGYVIQDHDLPWLRRLRPADAKDLLAGCTYTGVPATRADGRERLEGVDAAGAVAALCQEPLVHVSLLSGIIRGALANMGLSCTVTADAAASPCCSFQIRIPS